MEENNINIILALIKISPDIIYYSYNRYSNLKKLIKIFRSIIFR